MSDNDEVNASDVEAFRRALQEHGGPLAMAAKLNEGIFDAAGLDPVTFGLVRLAALAALGAPPDVWRANLEFADGLGVPADQVIGALIAVAPLIGSPRFSDAMMRIEEA